MKLTITYLIILLSSVVFTQDVHTVCHEGDCPEGTGAFYRTIQEAIDDCENIPDGSTILVEPGTYEENLIIQRDLNIVSRFAHEKTEEEMFEDWEEGLVKTEKGYRVHQDVRNTIIDGSKDKNAEKYGPRKYESTVMYNTPPGNGDQFDRGATRGSLLGFTVQGGRGTMALSNGDQFDRGSKTVKKGGGIYSNNSNPNAAFNQIAGNGDQFDRGRRSVNRGGGISISNGDQFDRGSGRYASLEALDPSQVAQLDIYRNRGYFDMVASVFVDDFGYGNGADYGNSLSFDPILDDDDDDDDGGSDDGDSDDGGGDDGGDDGGSSDCGNDGTGDNGSFSDPGNWDPTPAPPKIKLKIRTRGVILPVLGGQDPANRGYFDEIPAPDGDFGFGNFLVDNLDAPLLGNEDAIYEDVWVSINGSDEVGTAGTQADPFKTIERAMARVIADSTEKIVVNIKAGTYTNDPVTSNGEIFPIIMFSHIDLTGAGTDPITGTILDAQNQSKVLVFENSENNIISELIIQNGSSTNISDFNYEKGGGVFVSSSLVDFENVVIGPNLGNKGGGIFFQSSTSILNDVMISDNIANQGGGIYSESSNLTIYNSGINQNKANVESSDGSFILEKGGGLLIDIFSNVVIASSNINDNSARKGGGVYIGNSSSLNLQNVTLDANEHSSGLAETGFEAIAMLVENSNINMTNVDITNHNDDSNLGTEAVRVYYNSTLNIENSILLNSDMDEIIISQDNQGTGVPEVNVNYSHIPERSCDICPNGDPCGDNDEAFGNNFDSCASAISAITCDWVSGDGSLALTDLCPVSCNITTPGTCVEIVDDSGIPLPDGINPFNQGAGNTEVANYINTGNPDEWYTDSDGTRNNIGANGGSSILPSSTSIVFGNVGSGNTGNNAIIQNWSLYNFRDASITISEPTFTNNAFSIDGSMFPLTIEPHSVENIPISCSESALGSASGEMEIQTNDGGDPIDGATVALSAEVVEGTFLSGLLSGSYSGLQRIQGNLTINSGETVSIAPGTQFLFEGEHEFVVNGILEAEGTEASPIIFDNHPDSNSKWKGFSLYNQNRETIFKHVRISGAKKFAGGGMRLVNSSPIIENVEISGNQADVVGGGMVVSGGSGLELLNVLIQNNEAGLSSQNEGSSGYGAAGGLSLENTNNVSIENSVISGNTTYLMEGGGIWILESSSITLNSVEITNNNAAMGGGLVIGASSGIDINNCTISENSATVGGGIYIDDTEDPKITNTIIWDNTSDRGSSVVLSGNQEYQINHSNMDDGCIDKTYENGEDFYAPSWGNYGCYEFAVYWNTDSDQYVDTPYSDICEYYEVNDAGNGSPSEYCCACGGGISTSIIEFQGVGNQGVSPEFIGGDNYSLQASSSMIDAGIASLVLVDNTLIIDMSAEEYLGSAPDIGAYETVPGDINSDGDLNVVDLVIIIYYIVDPATYSLSENEILIANANADYDEGGDPIINILDVVTLIDMMFEQNGRAREFIDEISIYISQKGLHIDTEGFVALDIELSHTLDFEYSITQEAFVAAGNTKENMTRMIIADPYSDILFETEDLYDIVKITAVAINGEEVNVNFVEMPTKFSLSPAYPNPFNPVTTLDFALPNEMDVSIIVYDIQGREITTLVDGFMDIGYHSVIWNADRNASGMYFIKMVAAENLQTQKLILLK